MYQNFLLEIKNQRVARGCSVDDLSKETKISKKVIFKIENLNESEVDSFPQKHLLFLYAKHLGVEVPEITEAQLKQTEQKIIDIKRELSMIESTAVWHWFFTEDPNKKDQILKQLFQVMYEQQNARS